MYNHNCAKARLSSLLLGALCCPFVFAQTEGSTQRSKEETVLDNIVVVGTHIDLDEAAAEVAFTPGGVELIDLDKFREQNVSSMADVLRLSPGIWSASASGDDNVFLSSRGSNLDSTNYDMNGIKLLQDGLPVTTADGNNHNRIIDPLSARYAVVARGANAMTWGASTLGGAINFVSVTALDGTGVDLTLNGGSFGQILGRLTVAEQFGGKFDALGTIEAKHWDGYRDHNKQERFGFYANAGWQISDSVETRIYATWLNNDQELPGVLTREQMQEDPSQAEAAAVSGNYQVNVDTARLASKTTWLIDATRRLEFGLSLEEQSLYHPIVDRVMVDFDGPGPLPPVEVFSLLIDTDQSNFGASLRYNQQMGNHDFLAGINFGTTEVTGGNYRNLAGMKNGLTTEIDNDASLVEAFLTDRWKLNEHWTLVLAAQAVWADREVRNTDVRSGVLSNPHGDYSQVNPRVGLIYTLAEDASLYANISSVYEPPTNYQLQDNVAGGDAVLDAMKGTAIEVGTRGSYTFGRENSWGWDVAVYYTAIDDEILSVDDPFAPGTSLATNVDNTTHAGIEALFNATFSLGDSGQHFLSPLLSLTVNHFEFDSDPIYGDNQLPAAPDYTLRGEIMYDNSQGFHLGPTFDFIGQRYADFANTYVIHAYSLLGFRVGWEGKSWSANLEINNILDKNYVASHSVRNNASESDALLSPGAPRSAYATVRWHFK
jgi:iron complex outermembrane receptor protein